MKFPANTKLPIRRKSGIIILLAALAAPPLNSIAQGGLKGGVETPVGFLTVYVDGLAIKKSLTIHPQDLTRVLPRENKYGNNNVFLLNADAKDTVGLNYGEFTTQSNRKNTYRKVNDSLYEIYINDPGKQVLFGNTTNKEFGFGVIGAMSGGLNSSNLMGERIDTLTILEEGQKESYKVLPFNPFLYGLELYIWDKKHRPGPETVRFKILFQFPEPKLIGLRSDTAIINKKLTNPSLRYYDNVEFDKEHTYPGLRDRKAITVDTENPKHIFKKAENTIFLAFEHFAGTYRSEYFDNLQYKLDSQRDWSLTPLAYNPSILLENTAPGKHRLLVRYPVNAAPAFVYDFEILPDWRDSPLWPIITSILLTALVLFLFFRIRLKQAGERAKKNRLELQAIQAQLNPHFMFNALGSIQHLVHNDKQSADLYLTEFSNLLRHSLYNSAKEMVPLSVELETLNSYIRLEKLRFGFRFERQLDKHIEADNISIPALLIQPLIENAIKHGIAPLQKDGLLRITIFRQEQDLVVEITDNGKGFNDHRSATGLGLKLVKERIEVLKREGMRISLLFEDNHANRTTARVVFTDWL